MPLELHTECTVAFVFIENFLSGAFRTCLIMLIAVKGTKPNLTMQQIVSTLLEKTTQLTVCVSVHCDKGYAQGQTTLPCLW